MLNSNDAVKNLIATARGELGYLEKDSNAQLDSKSANAGHANYTKYARDLDKLGVYHGKKNGYAWCDMFVDWCFIQTFGLEIAMRMTFQPMGGYGAGCTASAQYYKSAGRFVKSNPLPGDQIFFSKDGGRNMYHTGLVVKVSGGMVYTIEGNTSSEAGVVENGGAVREKSYSLSYNKIAGYGRPDYSLVPNEEEDDEMMSEERFYEMFLQAMAKYTKKQNEQPVSGWAKESMDKAQAAGVMDGTMPKAPLTREQAAAIIDRIGALG